MDHQILVESHDERSIDDTPVDLPGLCLLMVDVCSAEGVPAGAETSLNLADPDYIAQLKADFLDGDGSPTDVLSFPIDGPIARTMADEERTIMLGDIVVCPSVAADQALGHAGNLEDELALLVVHGTLHLLGWDHDTDAARERMWARERELMAAFHRLPESDPWAAEGNAVVDADDGGRWAAGSGGANGGEPPT